MVADRHLATGRGAGMGGALAGVLALAAAGVLWALGLGFAAFAAALAVVAAVAALPWPRLPATEPRAG
jgi:hypothetical protein